MTEQIKTCLVTGGAKRIGRQIALDLAKDGWAVGIHYGGSKKEAQGVAGEIVAGGGKAAVVQGDLARPETPQEIIDETVAELGPLTLLVNNASRFEKDLIANMTVAEWDLHANINLRAPVFLAQAFAVQLPAGQKGNIINMIDERVWQLTPDFCSYTISKAGLWAATQTLAQALAPDIRVNGIGPGPALANKRMSEAEFEKQCRLMPLGIGTTPQEISSAIGFILSAPAMTGQMIALDGGQHLGWQTPDFVQVIE